MVGDLNRHCTKMHGFIHAVAVSRGKLKNVCDICKAETSETLAAHKMVHTHMFMKLNYL